MLGTTFYGGYPFSWQGYKGYAEVYGTRISDSEIGGTCYGYLSNCPKENCCYFEGECTWNAVKFDYTYSPEKPIIHDKVTFQASVFYDFQNVTYEWDFGDGTIASTSDTKIEHVYSKVGEFEVTLTVTVTDKIGSHGVKKKITVLCGVPKDGKLIIERIVNFGTCVGSGVVTKDPDWGRFLKQQDGILESFSGERLKIVCDNGTFRLYYAPPGGDFSYPKCPEHRCTIGMCPFSGGYNEVFLFHPVENEYIVKDKPDCFMETTWTSRDYGYENDKPNHWTGNVEENEKALDHAITQFFFNTKHVNKIDEKYEYSHKIHFSYLDPIPFHTLIPPLIPPLSFQPEGNFIVSDTVDPILGPETETFFDNIASNLMTEGLMYEDTSAPCDFDRNGVCDEKDYEFFMNIFGSCLGDPNYNPIADIDKNGCVDSDDKYYLFEQDYDGDGVPDVEDQCLGSDMRAYVIVDDCDTTIHNRLVTNGCTINDLLTQCAENPSNHGAYVSCVGHLTNGWEKDGLISGKEKGAIQSCAAKSDIQ